MRVEKLEVASGAVIRVQCVGEDTSVIRRCGIRGIQVHDVVNSHSDVPVRIHCPTVNPVGVNANVAADCIKQNGSNKLINRLAQN